ARAPVARQAIRFTFVGHGETAPRTLGPRDRIYLDVGNDLRPGVLDHHHLTAGAGSTSSLVLTYPSFLDEAVRPDRRPDDPPPRAATAPPRVAVRGLARGAPRGGAHLRARSPDALDAGPPPLSQGNPFSLYAAYFVLADRLLKRPWNSPQECWQEQARAGLEL